MITYKDIAEAWIEDEGTQQRYSKFMHTRWHDDEKENCICGIAQHWARIFQDGIEFNCVDTDGLRILYEIEGMLTNTFDTNIETLNLEIKMMLSPEIKKIDSEDSTNEKK